MASASDIRTAFLDYFARHGHEIVASGPLVPRNDPTLMFTNAGMVQFKNVFTGSERRAYNRAVTSQKCVRAGGKHNDLENVGYTARHHTFFEMLGNFSFGDYFKDLAIELAWKLITREYGLPEDRLLVTVYAEDDEAAALWKKIAGLPEGRILRIPTSDNFWAMGDTGPCGPCSEIFYDHGAHIPGGPPGSPDEDGDRFIEIWNLVFMQFEQVTPEERISLPRPSIDTGMGLERLAAVLQGKHDNYEIDLMQALIHASAEASGVDAAGPHAVSHRVIADHLRASGFLIADGVLPANEGRGYVLRRIMRRAMRHAHIIGCREPLLHRLAPALVREMGGAFPELGQASALIAETLRLEEERFKQTLGRGLRLLDEAEADLDPGEALPGGIAFRLYDTYGFPLDLTRDVLRGRGRGVDEAGFETEMARVRAEARKAWAGSGEAAAETLWFDLRERLGATEFLGYETLAAEAEVLALIAGGSETAHFDEAGGEVQVIVNQTPFYGESGGQAGDRGGMTAVGGAVLQVLDTQKTAGGLHVHLARLEKGALEVGEAVGLRVDGMRRAALRRNHSATHLLHRALRDTLGAHVAQKGSLVAPERLRFDISHPKPMASEELAAVSAAVNDRVRRNAPVSTRLMATDNAIEAGALALFGEKYGDEVRVVTMGGEDGGGRPWSVELCGGTHVAQTGDIGQFVIVEETALAAGVRRIEALTGESAEAHVAERLELLDAAAAALRTAPAAVPARVAQLLEERRRMEREIAELRRKAATGGGGAAFEEIGGKRLSRAVLEDVPARELKAIADDLKQQIGSGVVALAAVNGGKASLVVGVTDDLAPSLSAVDLVRLGAAALGGKGGGGRPDMAQAGGPDGARAPEALAAIADALAG